MSIACAVIRNYDSEGDLDEHKCAEAALRTGTRRPLSRRGGALAGTAKKNEVVRPFARDAVDLVVDDALANDVRSSTIWPGQPQAQSGCIGGNLRIVAIGRGIPDVR